MKAARAFTLVEILLALFASTLIIASIYGVFSRAIRIRDNAVARTHETRLRARAANVIREDLRNAYVSGGLLATALKGAEDGPESRFPGYLKFTATTGRDSIDELHGDVQQIEYFVVNDNAPESREAGTLVRALDRNLLANVREPAAEQPLLTKVKAIEVAFYDGADWKDSWEVTKTAPALPEAVRMRILQLASSEKANTPPPIEITVPWTAHSPVKATSAEAAGMRGASDSEEDEADDITPDQQEGTAAGSPGPTPTPPPPGGAAG